MNNIRGLVFSKTIAFAFLFIIVAGTGWSYLSGDEFVGRVVGKDVLKDVPPQASPVGSRVDERKRAQAEARGLVEAEVKAPVPPSPWVEAEKKRYTDILAAAKPAVVVMPFFIPEGQGRFGIDLSARMVMAYLTAQRIATDAGIKVADVGFVARAIGEPRHFPRNDALNFGHSVGARLVVFGETFHDGAGRLTVKVTAVKLSGQPGMQDTEEKVWSKSHIDFSDQVTPELAFGKFIDEVVPAIGFVESKPVTVKKYSASPAPLARTPIVAIANAAANPADGIWMQELIGSLFSDEVLRERHRVFERALASIEYLAPDSPDYRLLKARALAHLGRRSAAIALMDGALSSPEGRAYAAFLNGNYSEMQDAIAKINRPVPKLVAELERQWLASAYNDDPDALNASAKRIAGTVPKEWAPAIIWFVTGQSQWGVGPTTPVKLVMDAHFPIKDFSAEDVVRGKAVMGIRDSKIMFEIEGAPITHATKVLDQRGKDWCCEPLAWKPQDFQYMNLLAATAEGLIIRNVDHA